MRRHDHPLIDLYFAATVPCRQVTVMLEECELPYRLRSADQADAAVPAHRLPVLVDHETGLHVVEAGAILQYLADKTGRFLAVEPDGRYAALSWVFWQAGPTLDLTELDATLRRHHYLSDEFSIADIACFARLWPAHGADIDPHRLPGLHRWLEAVRHRPGVRHGMDAGLAATSTG